MGLENLYWKVLQLNWFRKSKSEDRPAAQPSISIKQITFADGTKIDVEKNSIVVVTGPNNVGKSSLLRELERALSSSYTHSPVVSNVEIQATGTVAQFKEYVESRSLKGRQESSVLIGRSEYDLKKIDDDLTKSFRGSDVSQLFLTRLSAGDRLSLGDSSRREDWTTRSPSDPIQWLDIETEAEDTLSKLFKSVFGVSLVVNRTAGDRIVLHTTDQEPPEFESFREYISWISKLRTLREQGDGMRSFAAVLLHLIVRPKSLVLIDEPEAFLHYPQARKLAEIVGSKTHPDTQIWLATHNDEIVRGILDNAKDRVILVRLDRIGDKPKSKLLKAAEVSTLWTDPLLRTSDVLSALFHEVAVLCEGESDARFFRALIDANVIPERMPDLRFYQVGGKDKFVSIVSSLRLLDLPVCIVADIDILSDIAKFLNLFEAMGGNRRDIEKEVKEIAAHVMQRKPPLSGRDVSQVLKSIAEEAQTQDRLTPPTRSRISSLLQDANPWDRIKEDGYRGFGSAAIIVAFEKVYGAAKRVGFVINREGELEGLCRDISKKPKSAWLSEVLTRNLANDNRLSDARSMLEEIRESISNIRSDDAHRK